MATIHQVTAQRVMTKEEATLLVGVDVPHAEPTVSTPTRAVDADTGQPVFAYLPLGDVSELRRAALGIEFHAGGRASGLVSASRTFGYSQRRPVYQREGCSLSSLGKEQRAQHDVLAGFSDRLAPLLEQVDPALAENGRTIAAQVEPDWRLGESKLWTSGVINQSSILPYHRDAFNFPAWSAMPVLRRHMAGGYLRIPEYGAVIPCRDGWAVFFAGYELVHGVTPMRLVREGGYRYSIVYYALKGMKDCYTAALETRYALEKRTAREQEMARRLAEGEPSDIRPIEDLGSITLGRQRAGLTNNLPRGTHDTGTGRMMGGKPVSGRGAGGQEPGTHNLTGRRATSARIIGGRSGYDFAEVTDDTAPTGSSVLGPSTTPEPKRAREIAEKKAHDGRVIGGRSEVEFDRAVDSPLPPAGSTRRGAHRKRRADITGDPTAIEDARHEALEGDPDA